MPLDMKVHQTRKIYTILKKRKKKKTTVEVNWTKHILILYDIIHLYFNRSVKRLGSEHNKYTNSYTNIYDILIHSKRNSSQVSRLQVMLSSCPGLHSGNQWISPTTSYFKTILRNRFSLNFDVFKCWRI